MFQSPAFIHCPRSVVVDGLTLRLRQDVGWVTTGFAQGQHLAPHLPTVVDCTTQHPEEHYPV